MALNWRQAASAGALAFSVVAPGPTASGQTSVPLDSQQIRQNVRSAQVRFERTRRRHMRWTTPRYDQCDQRIGRYCLSDVDWGADEDWAEPEESRAVNEARAVLIAQLDSAAQLLPGDDWIAGQRVRYLVEAEDTEAALRAADTCRSSTDWWCRALAGFAFYAARDYVQAELAFGEATAHMDEELRCAWNDLSEVLDGKIRNRYQALSCAERDSLQRRILWLADPFHSIPGNELTAEHYARQVHSALLRDAESPEGDRWGGDLHRFIVRYGWTFGWERVRRSSPATLDPEITGHFGHGAKYFLPNAEMVDGPARIVGNEWDLEPFRPIAGHAPPYAASAFDSLSHQVTGFLVGDSIVVVTAFQITDDSIPPGAEVHVALVLSRTETAVPIVVRDTIAKRVGALAATIPAVPHIMSLEVLAVEERRAARARYGVGPGRLLSRARRGSAADPDVGGSATADPDPVEMLSGLLMTYVEDSLLETLDAVAPLARPNNRLRPGERFGLFWELYGVGPGAQRVGTSLTLTRTGKSVLQRVAGFFGLVSDKPPIGFRWDEITRPYQDTLRRSVAVALPENLSPGRYVLKLTITLENGRFIALEKPVVVIDH